MGVITINVTTECDFKTFIPSPIVLLFLKNALYGTLFSGVNAILVTRKIFEKKNCECKAT